MKKIACIGDSITWGFTLLNPWKQSYPALLQERLGTEYEVRNFGYNDAAYPAYRFTTVVRPSVRHHSSQAW